MIGERRTGKVWIYGAPVKRGLPFDALARLAVEKMGQDIVSGDYYVFVNRRRRTIRALQWDGTGFVVYFKQIEGAQCMAPWVCVRSDGLLRLAAQDLWLLLEGSEWVGHVTLSPLPPAATRITTSPSTS